jgi:hypothetical protein
MIYEVLALRVDHGAQGLFSQILRWLIVVMLDETGLHEGDRVVTDLPS